MININLVLAILAIVSTLIAPFLPGWARLLRRRINRNLP